MIGGLIVLSLLIAILWFRTWARLKDLQKKFGPVLSLEEEERLLRTSVAGLKQDRERLAQENATLTEAQRVLEETEVLSEMGFYKPVYGFSSSEKYERRLEKIRDEQKAVLKSGQAATCSTEWSVNGSKAEGRKSTNQTLRLLLRAFNGESDAAIAKVNYKNVATMEARIRKAADAISALAKVASCSISPVYVELKIQELQLVHEYEEKLEDEREEQRQLREQMREEELHRREIEKAQREAEQDRRRNEEALRQAKDMLSTAHGAAEAKLQAKIAELEERLAEVAERERQISLAQLTRQGHVYVISNIGSFGDTVFKIGMTRRWNEYERVDELGDASVPFPFDVHAMIKTTDAPALETALHRAFDHLRVNRVNTRKEFFRVTLEEIEAVVKRHHGEFELTKLAEAEQYRKTLALIADEERRKPQAQDVAEHTFAQVA